MPGCESAVRSSFQVAIERRQPRLSLEVLRGVQSHNISHPLRANGSFGVFHGVTAVRIRSEERYAPPSHHPRAATLVLHEQHNRA